MVIDTFLYNELKYKINQGTRPLLFNGDKLNNYVQVPYVTWDINFGLIDEEFKNYLEGLLVTSNNIQLVTQIHPMMYLSFNDSENLVTYIYPHEQMFYGVKKIDKSRSIQFVKSGTNIIIENFNFSLTTNNKIPKAFRLPHKVHYLNNSISVSHKSNNLYTMSASFKEVFNPFGLQTAPIIIGESSASNPGTC